MKPPKSFLGDLDANESPLADDVIAQMTAKLTPKNKDLYDIFKKSPLAQTSLAGQPIQIGSSADTFKVGGSVGPFRVVGPSVDTISSVAQPTILAANLSSIAPGQVIDAYKRTESSLSSLPPLDGVILPGTQLVRAMDVVINSTPSMNSVSDLVGALLGVTSWTVRAVLQKPLLADWIDAISGVGTMVISGITGDWLKLASAAFTSTIALLDMKVQAIHTDPPSRTPVSYELSQTGAFTWPSVLLAESGPAVEMLMHVAEALGKAGEIVRSEHGSVTATS